MTALLRLLVAFSVTADLLCIQFRVWALYAPLALMIWLGSAFVAYALAIVVDLVLARCEARRRDRAHRRRASQNIVAFRYQPPHKPTRKGAA